MHSTFIFAGDPFMIRPLARQVSDVGGRMVAADALAGPHHTRLLGSWDALPFPVFDAPSLRMEVGEDADCIIGTSDGRRRRLDRRTVELGFPSYNSHAFHDCPYLGFEGAMSLLSRIADDLLWNNKRTIPASLSERNAMR